MAQNDLDLLPCPFCGGPAVLTVRPGSRAMLHCDNTDCYAAWVRFTAYSNGDSDERTRQRLTAWWNRRTVDNAGR